MNFKAAFTVPGQPVAKGRPRIGQVNGHAMAFTDRKTENYEALVSMCARPVAPPIPLDTALAVTVAAVFERPAYLLARSKRTGELLRGVEGRMPHTGRPDLDNCIKAVLDGANRAGIWRDDSQVGRIVAEKWYAAVDEAPHVEVTVEAGANESA